jgi:hypothetical protein
MDDPNNYKDHLAMTFEGHEKVDKWIASLYRGWFTAPDTKRYRFHLSCNDHCNLRLGNTPDQTTDWTEHVDIDHWSEFRRTSYSTRGGGDRISDWISLEKGQRYYIESAHLDGWSWRHFSMGVEIEQEVMNPNHPNNVKEV